MVIVFDIGNTNIKMGVFNGDELSDTLRMASANKTGDEYWLLIKDMLALKNISARDVEGAIISSVNPNLNYTFEHMVETYFGFKPMTVGSGGQGRGVRCGEQDLRRAVHCYRLRHGYYF